MTLLEAPNDIEAHLVAGRLAEVGIESRLVKNRAAPGAWLHGGQNPWAPCLVLVRRFQLDDARLCLAEVALEAPVSVQVSLRSGSLWWSVALGLGVVLSLLVLAQVVGGLSV